MKRHEWIIVFVPLFLTWIFDQATKQWATGLIGINTYAGIFSFVLHHNPGAMLGLFSDLPPVLRVVSLSTGGAFLFCTYGIIQYLLPIKSLMLRSGLSILIGGILGNVTDRIIWGHVVDFIVIGTPQLSSPAFNIADALQWVGYGLIVTAIIKEGELLWPENNSRKQYWINMKFQLKYCFILMGLGLGIGLIALVFSYTYLRVTMIDLIGHNPLILDRFLKPFALTFAFIAIGFSVGLFLVGKIISHKIAGPIYAFEKFIDDSFSGMNRALKLRKQDEFKHLEMVAHRIQENLIKVGVIKQKEEQPALPVEIAEIEGSNLIEKIEQESTIDSIVNADSVSNKEQATNKKLA
jgi:signal peptidase II